MRELLQQLKGARLSTFVALALNETEICLGRRGPLSVHAIAAQTGMSARNVLRAVQHLAQQKMVTTVSECGDHREKLYRVSRHIPTGARPTAKKRSPVDPDKLTGSKTSIPPVSRRKTKIDPDNLSGSVPAHTSATAVAPKLDSRGDRDKISGPSTAIARISRRKIKTDHDKLSGSAPAQSPATVVAPTPDSRVDHDTPARVAGPVPANAPIFRGKARIRRDAQARASGPSRHLSRARTRARVVVVNTTPELVLAFKQQQHFTASREIFAAVHVEGSALMRLARTVDADLAREWTERLDYAPESFTDPVGFMIKHLLRNPTEAPPYAWQKPKKKSWYGDEFAKYVHGRPEHTQYCREHPELVDCDCGKVWLEERQAWVDGG